MRKLGIFAHGEEKVSVHRDEPVLMVNSLIDVINKQLGRLSITLAKRRNVLEDIITKKMSDSLNSGVESLCIYHMPTGKRMFPDVFRHDEDTEMWAEVAENLGPAQTSQL